MLFGMLDAIEAAARRDPDGIALTSPGRPAVRYRQLLGCLHAVRSGVAELGLGPTARVAGVAVDSRDAAVAFLGVGSACAYAPLDPKSTADDVRRHFDRVDPAAVVVPGGTDSPARDVAVERDLFLLELTTPPDMTSARVRCVHEPKAARPAAPVPDGTALLLPTSGTTSRPKLVALGHRNLAWSAQTVGRTLGLSPTDRCSSVMPMFHIHGLVAGLLAPLTAGGSVSCVAGGLDAGAMADWLETEDATWFTAVPTMHHALVVYQRDRAVRRPRRLRFVRSASTAMPVPLALELEAMYGVPVVEAYGMTEAAHEIASNPPTADGRVLGTVGRPTGCEVAIRSEAGETTAPDTVGEVLVRGPGVTSGYLDDPQVNAGAFVGGWFRTGDQGFLDERGYLTLTGRLTELINRGGRKISPRTVEDVLLQHPAVATVAAFPVPHPSLGQEVAAAVVPERRSRATEDELRAFASGRLAYFQVPRRIVVVDELPKGPTGKVQRLRLADALDVRPSGSGEPPATPTESAVAELWRTVLDRGEVGVVDDFFLLGGDSFVATRVLARVRQRFGVEVPAAEVYSRAATIRGMAGLVDALASGAVSEPRADNGDGDRGGAVPPLTAAQLGIWIEEQMPREDTPYNVAFGVRMWGQLAVPQLRAALDELVVRHSALRTTFLLTGDGPAQRLGSSHPVALPVVDLQAVPPGTREACALERAAAEGEARFDLERGPLFRPVLFRLGPEDHMLALYTHHLVVDAWSRRLVRRDLLALYERAVTGRTDNLPELDASYPEVGWRAAKDPSVGRRYWQDRFTVPPPYLELDTDRPRLVRPAHRGGCCETALPAGTAADLTALGRADDASLFMVLLAGYVVVLHRATGQHDIVIGCPVSGRTNPNTDDVVGLFANVVPVRATVQDRADFREVLREVRDSCLEAFAHADVPAAQIVDDVKPERVANRSPLFQTTFGSGPRGERRGECAGLRFEHVDIGLRSAKYDLSVDVSPADAGDWLVRVDYDSYLFNAERVERLAATYLDLLGAVANDPALPVRPG